MSTVITRKHFLQILRYFGIRKAIRVMFSRRKTALLTLVK